MVAEVPGTIVSVLRRRRSRRPRAHEGLAGDHRRRRRGGQCAGKDPEQLDVLADAGAVDAMDGACLVRPTRWVPTICGQAPARAVYEPAARVADHHATQRPAPQFEVMYLLAVAVTAAAADQLRIDSRNCESVAIAAAPPDSYLHTSTPDDAGAAVEAGLAVGELAGS